MTRGKRTLLLLVAAALLPSLAWASGASEVFTRTSLALILMITLADACGFLFERLGLPELVGEISAGILLGNLALLGIDFNFTALLRDSEFMTYSSELAKALLFFGGAVFIGQRLMPQMVHMVAITKHASIWTGFAFCLALGFAELAALAGLAPLIGAFVAGLLLDDVYFRVGATLQKHTLEELIRPISDILISIFFVGVGAQVQLEVLADSAILLTIVALTLVAIGSKTIAGYMVKGRGFDRLGIGFGMVPRGEVGLVFAAFAFSHGIFMPKTYTALIMVVLLTTIIGPALLKPRLSRF